MRTRHRTEVLGIFLAAGALTNCGREPGPPPATPVASPAPAAPRAPIASANQAIQLLIDTVKRDKLYENWRSIECLVFLPDAEDNKGYDIEVRQSHDPPCDGDPNFAPIVDRFRVTREGNILWFDTAAYRHHPYEQVRDSIRRPQRH